jgi:hypothetical protein
LHGSHGSDMGEITGAVLLGSGQRDRQHALRQSTGFTGANG